MTGLSMGNGLPVFFAPLAVRGAQIHPMCNGCIGQAVSSPAVCVSLHVFIWAGPLRGPRLKLACWHRLCGHVSESPGFISLSLTPFWRPVSFVLDADGYIFGLSFFWDFFS